MSAFSYPVISRKSFLFGAASLGAGALLPRGLNAAVTPVKEMALAAAPGRLPLVGATHPDTAVWCYGGRIPGPEIRILQGQRLRVRVENHLPEETTVHWHGVRVPNAMDGVPHLTQKPIEPGQTFTYEFDCPDAGTFWYHPHHRSFEQVGRGLAGALIVEEAEPLTVDRDLTWVLGDWRLTKDAAISDDFGNMHDTMHAGRIGNTVTVNGRVAESFAARAGERIRLRLINAANARIFALEFDGHAPQVIALDGQPVDAHVPEDGRVLLGPGMRTDILLDFTEKPGSRFPVRDTFYQSLEYSLLNVVYGDEPPLRDRPSEAVRRLLDNPLAEPALAAAQRHELKLGGGMMGGMMSAMMDGRQADMRTMMHNGLAWAINGIAAKGHMMDPLLVLERGHSYILTMINDTTWHHPMHLHGHSFRVIGRNAKPTRFREWQDTVLIPPRERADIAFVADNPGDWMIHCHILEHQAGGMMGMIRVT
jgi:FtsP/CotA-like multicopper oxidase with cupredoxin domain